MMSLLSLNTLRTLDGEHVVNVADILQSGSSPNKDATNYIGYKREASGSVLRTLADSLEDVISVKDFGAKGNNTTDDTAAINAAIAAAAAYSSRGAGVYFPSGWYNVSATITVPDNVKLIGPGLRSTLIRCTADGGTVGTIINISGSNAGIKGLEIRYSSAQKTTGTGIVSIGSNNILTEFSVMDCYNGIQVSGGTGQRITKFEIYDCKNIGLLVGQNNTAFVNDIFVDEYIISSNDLTNFSLGSVRVVGRVEALFLGRGDLIGSTYPFTSDPGTTQGLRFSNFSQVFFDGHSTAALFNGVNHTSFTDCWFSGRGNNSAIFQNCFGLNFKGIRCYNNNYQGFQCIDCHHFTIDSSDFSFNNTSSGTNKDDIWIGVGAQISTSPTASVMKLA